MKNKKQSCEAVTRKSPPHLFYEGNVAYCTVKVSVTELVSPSRLVTVKVYFSVPAWLRAVSGRSVSNMSPSLPLRASVSREVFAPPSKLTDTLNVFNNLVVGTIHNVQNGNTILSVTNCLLSTTDLSTHFVRNGQTGSIIGVGAVIALGALIRT